MVFDVHGTPPYVSAECDEADGFRISWNTAYTATEFVSRANSSEGVGQPMPTARAQSSNLYNAYGADTAPENWPQPLPWNSLRLMRQGHRFACFFQVMSTGPWRCAGEASHHGMPGAVHLRLAAKHWPKNGGYAVGTRVRLRHFQLHQPQGHV